MNEIRWGIIGCGDVAERKGGPSLYHAEGSRLLAVMSRNLAKAKAFAHRHGAERIYDSVEQLLADPDIDAVYIATPVSLHCPYTIQAAEAGKHVLCEKPMGMNVAECEQMIAACRKNGVSLMVAYYRRRFPNIMKMKELIVSGAIGDVVLAKVHTHSPISIPPLENPPWRFQPGLSGGGVLMDIGCHRLDLLLYLLGDVEDVSGQAKNLSLPFPVDDSVVFRMWFRSGALAVGSFHWNIPVKADSLEVFGTKGKLSANPIGSGKLVLETSGTVQEMEFPNLPYTHLGLVEDFVNHLRTGGAICCPGEEAMKTNRLMADIYRRDE